MLVTQAIMYLGGVADKESGGVIFDPDLSRFYIDLLGVIEEKTKGNVTDEEAKMLSSTLHQLRAQFTMVASGQVPEPMPEPAPAPKKAEPKSTTRERRPRQPRDGGDKQRVVGLGEHVPAFMRR